MTMALNPVPTKAKKTVKASKANGSKRKLNGSAPIKEDPIAVGLDAWARLKTNARATWEDWKQTGFALLVGRNEAMKAAHTDIPKGRRYNEEFGHWLNANGFGDIDASTRAKLLSIMGRLDEIEAWRAGLTEGQRACWVSPTTVWRISHCKDRGMSAYRNKKKKKETSAAASEVLATDDGDEDGEFLEPVDATDDDESDDGAEKVAELDWQRTLSDRARKAKGAAGIQGEWLLGAPEPGLLSTVYDTATAWVQLYEYLVLLSKASTPKAETQAHEWFRKSWWGNRTDVKVDWQGAMKAGLKAKAARKGQVV